MLDRLAELLTDPVPGLAVVAERPASEQLRLGFPAVATLMDVWSVAGRRGSRLSWADAMAGVRRWLDVLGALHDGEARRGRSGGLGHLSWADMLVAWDGSIGFVPLTAVCPPSVDPLIPPSRAAGGAPSPSSDLWTLMALARTALPFVTLPEELAATLRGDGPPSDLAAQLAAINVRLFAAEPSARMASVAELEVSYADLWARFGVGDDLAALATFIRDNLPPTHGTQVRMTTDGRLTQVGDRELDLTRRRVPRELWRTLVTRHTTGQAPASVPELVQAIWPGERILADAAAARVYAAIRWLRRQGLEGVLLTRGDGYGLTPDATVRLVPAGSDLGAEEGE
jgi:hypothetical protein